MRSVYLRNSYVQYTEWRCTSTSESSQCTPKPKRFSLGRMPSEAISSVNREMSGSVHQDTGRTVGPWTWLDVHTLVSQQRKPFVLHREAILIQALWFHVVDDVETLNYEGVSAMPPVPTHTSPYSFRKNIFRKIEFGIDSRNISRLAIV